jgi:hypothetical protein
MENARSAGVNSTKKVSTYMLENQDPNNTLSLKAFWELSGWGTLNLYARSWSKGDLGPMAAFQSVHLRELTSLEIIKKTKAWQELLGHGLNRELLGSD